MIDLGELVRFLVKAKRGTYAGDGREIMPQRPGFKELEFSEGDWNYRDSYVGFFRAPGQEVVRFQGQPVWTMSYDGGMLPNFRDNVAFAKETFVFLKRALSLCPEHIPFRGPYELRDREMKFQYINFPEGNVTDFRGSEHIHINVSVDSPHPVLEVFRQNYFGGLVIPNSWSETLFL
ncbi:XRE family transcriptional regulator [Candidatus Woesearchaeota archaeon]|nr:XRE family transcriptional regulator [Candidatus Woesearchaeota archaeon]